MEALYAEMRAEPALSPEILRAFLHLPTAPLEWNFRNEPGVKPVPPATLDFLLTAGPTLLEHLEALDEAISAARGRMRELGEWREGLYPNGVGSDGYDSLAPRPALVGNDVDHAWAWGRISEVLEEAQKHSGGLRIRLQMRLGVLSSWADWKRRKLRKKPTRVEQLAVVGDVAADLATAIAKELESDLDRRGTAPFRRPVLQRAARILNAFCGTSFRPQDIASRLNQRQS